VLILRGFWSGGSITGAHTVLLLAVRIAHHRGSAAAEDWVDIATLRAGRVRAAML